MPRLSPSVFLPLWDRALDPDIEIGIAIKFTGVERTNFVINYLYAAKNTSADPSKYEGLILFQPGGSHIDEVWICKKEVELGPDA